MIQFDLWSRIKKSDTDSWCSQDLTPTPSKNLRLLVTPQPFFPGHSSHMTEVVEIFLFGEVTQHSGFYGFHSCALFCKVSHVELIAKTHLCHLHLRWHS